MQRLILVHIFLLITCVSYSQDDDAISIIDAIKDTVSGQKAQIDALNEFALKRVKTNKQLVEKVSEEALHLSQEIEYQEGEADAFYNIGYTCVFGPYPKAINNLTRAYDLYVSLRDTLSQANTLLSLALVYDGMEDVPKAIQTARTGLELAERIGHKKTISRAQTNISTFYHHVDNLDSALYHGRIALKLKEEIGDEFGTLLIRLNLGVIMANYDSLLDEGLVYLHAARKSTDEPYMTNDIVSNLAYAYARKKDFKMAQIYLDSAQLGTDSIANEYTERGLYRIAWEMYYELGNYEKALEYLQQEFELDKQLRGLEVQEKYEVLQLEYENEKNQNQILKLQNEQAETKFRYTIAVVLVFYFLLVAGLIYILMRFKVRNARLKEVELRNQLEQKNKELTSYALNFVQKNDLIANIRSQVNDLKSKADKDSIKDLNQINRIIDDSFRADKEWSNFKLRFEEVHTDFFQRLSDKYPDLSNAEVRLCALIKLNMNMKEASQVLGISPDSVKTARYRIRKKMDLPTDVNLTSVINSI